MNSFRNFRIRTFGQIPKGISDEILRENHEKTPKIIIVVISRGILKKA